MLISSFPHFVRNVNRTEKMCLYFGDLQVFLISIRFPETEAPVIVTDEPIKSAGIFILYLSLVIPFSDFGADCFLGAIVDVFFISCLVSFFTASSYAFVFRV
jgi:hypothetical protein